MSESLYTSDWDVYFCYLENFPAFISIDLGAAMVAPLVSRPTLLEIMIGLQTTEENGFPEEEEWEKLEQIEDTIVSTFEKKLDARFVAKTLNNGKRGLYFYTGEVMLLEQLMEAVTAAFPDYRFEFQETADEAWSVYFNYLYPDAESLQKIYNNRMLLNLEEQGDQSFVPRPVFHTIYFSSQQNQADFINSIAGEEFKIVSQEKEESESGTTYKLLISREDTTEEETIQELTLMLHQLAAQQQGKYEGWHTQVVKENN